METDASTWGSLPPDPRRRTSAPAARNRDAILQVLRRVFPSAGSVVEAASGTGEHAVYFAAVMPGWIWQPSEVDPDNADSINAWIEATGLPNVLRPLPLNLDIPPQASQPSQRYAAGFCANLVHIAPWHVCTNLMAFMGAHLEVGAPLVTYGPYKVNGKHTSQSNEQFEAWLKSRDPAYGVRDMADVISQAAHFGISHVETVAMPANNFCLVFRNSPQRQ